MPVGKSPVASAVGFAGAAGRECHFPVANFPASSV